MSADTDNSPRTVEACPECDHTDIYERTTTNDYRCSVCGTEFDDPTIRGTKYDSRSPKSTGRRYRCYQCGGEFRSESDKPWIHGPCGHDVVAWRARVAFFEQNTTVRALASGPQPRGDVRITHNHIRTVVRRLKVPLGDSGTTKSRPNAQQREGVVYLPGDERAAIRLFIDLNEAYVADCLADGHNPFQSQWSDDLYQLLVEQWEWTRGEGP